MKRAIVAVALAGLVGALAAPASADVFVFALIEKEKDVFVQEFIDINKVVVLVAVVNNFPEGAAEALAIANQRTEFNVVLPLDPSSENLENILVDPDNIDQNDMRLNKHVLIEDSITSNRGIVGVNQDVGNMSNQGNLVANSVTLTGSSAVNAEASASQFNDFNFVVHVELDPLFRGPHFTTKIVDSINDNAGVVGVNQNAGNMNNQLNMVAVAVGLGSEFALAEADLGQFNAFNLAIEFGTVKTAEITNSINGNRGIVGVNQSVGNMANQANVVSIAAALDR